MRRLTFASHLARLLLFAASAFLAPNGSASELKPSEIRGDQNRNAVSVLQNRYFLKTWRPELGFMAGTFMNESYTDTSYMGLRGAVFFNEWLGLELQHSTTTVADSDDRKALNQLKYKRISDDAIVTPDPEINPIHEVTEANLVYAPFYGKLNLMDMFIVYSDLYLTGGIAQVKTEQGQLPAAILGAGQRFYWGQATALRIEYRSRIYDEKRAGQKTQKKAHSFDIGMSYFFF